MAQLVHHVVVSGLSHAPDSTLRVERTQVISEREVPLKCNPMSNKKKEDQPHVVRVVAHNIVTRMRMRWPNLPSDEQRLKKIEQASGVSVPTLRRIVRPSSYPTYKSPSIVNVEKIAMALRCETHELFIDPDEGLSEAAE